MYNKNQNKMNKEQLRMQMLAGIITESQYKEKLNEEVINFTDKEQFYSFLNKFDEGDFLEGKTVILNVSKTSAMQDPKSQSYAGNIELKLGKRTGGNANITYDATVVDAGGYEYLKPARGKQISWTFPSTSNAEGKFGKNGDEISGLYNLKTLDIR